MLREQNLKGSEENFTRLIKKTAVREIMKKSFNIVYSSDLHGNEVQYRKLVDCAFKIKADSVIIGGDITPKGSSSTEDHLKKLREPVYTGDEFIDRQHDFLKTTLPALLGPLERLCPVYLIMGNDDAKINEHLINNSRIFANIHNKRIKLTDDFDVVGYSYVPITPFGIKDWEKFDMSEPPESLKSEYQQRKETNYQLHGFKSTKSGWKIFVFDKTGEQADSIQRDLEGKLYTKNANKTVYVIHTPPDRTTLDQIFKGWHVGSMAVRLFIEKVQPYLTLHGHIHETVHRSGHFKQIIGKTISLASGNHNIGENLAVVIFDLYNPAEAERKII